MNDLRSLSNLSSSSSIPASDAGYMLHLRVHSGEKLSLATTRDSFCEVNVTGGDELPRSYQTKVYKSRSMTIAVWNEKLAIPVRDPSLETVSIRVKNKNPLTSVSIGACTIGLKHLQVGHTIDQSFTLYQGSKNVGRIRLQMLRGTSTDTAQIQIPQQVETRPTTKSSNQDDISDGSGSSDDDEDEDEEELRASSS